MQAVVLEINISSNFKVFYYFIFWYSFCSAFFKDKFFSPSNYQLLKLSDFLKLVSAICQISNFFAKW